MKSIISMPKRIMRLIYYGFLLIKIGGLGVFFRQFKHHIYSRSSQVSLTLNLDEYKVPEIEASIKYNLKLATKEDMKELQEKAKSETKEMAQKLLFRKWMYEDGYKNCYVARTVDTNEICTVACIIFPTDDKKVAGKFKNWFPRLQEDEVILEGAYTFEKFRGKRLHPSIIIDRLKVCQEKGYKRVLAYIEENNAASLKGAERTGFKRFGSTPELKFMFLTFRKYTQLTHSQESKTVPVRIIDPTTDNRWDEFVNSQKDSTIFHTSAWARVIKETYRYLPQYHVLEDDNGQIKAVIPFYYVQSNFTGKRLVCLPFSDYCWPLGKDKVDISSLIDAAKDRINKESTYYLEIRGWNTKYPPDDHYNLSPYNYYTRQLLELGPDIDTLTAVFHLSVRRCIQQAEKRNITVRLTNSEEDMECFYKLHVATQKKIGVLPQPGAFFKNLYRHIISKNQGFLGIAEYEGKTVAGVVFLTYGDTIYYKFNASDEKFLQKRPNHLIIWEALKFACTHNYKYFDFGRCSPEEKRLWTFKTRWGAKEIALPYYYFPERSNLLTNTKSSVKNQAMKLLSHITPRWIYAATGSLLYKHLG